MKYLLSAFLLTLTPLAAQEDTPEAPAKDLSSTDKADTPAVEMWQAFSNLPKEKRTAFGTQLTKAQNLLAQKRVFDALQALDELDKIFPDHPSVLNLRGACYVEIRSFDKASAAFDKVLKFSPDNINTLFNIAEVEFVTKKWASAHQRFTELVSKVPETQKPMLRLCEFKLLLCKLKLDKIDEAKALMEKYDEWDDSPYYYYSRAAVEYHADNKKEAEKKLQGARHVFRGAQTLAPWQDTLVEFGYIRSFFGEPEDQAEQ